MRRARKLVRQGEPEEAVSVLAEQGLVHRSRAVLKAARGLVPGLGAEAKANSSKRRRRVARVRGAKDILSYSKYTVMWAAPGKQGEALGLPGADSETIRRRGRDARAQLVLLDEVDNLLRLLRRMREGEVLLIGGESTEIDPRQFTRALNARGPKLRKRAFR